MSLFPFTPFGYLIPAVLCIAISASIGHAADGNGPESVRGPGTRVLFSVDYFLPTGEDRDIRTFNMNLYALLGEIEILRLSLNPGLTATYATGSIRQLEGKLSEGTLREVRYDNRAFGLGPGLSVELRLLRLERLSILLSGIGSFIIYDKRFPAGGEYYNFMWRGGPVLRFALFADRFIGISYQWMHVSNGQGTGSRNPSYDARGVILQWIF
jgi:lipid A 3-O-deacylase